MIIGDDMLMLSNQRSVLHFRVFESQIDGKLTLFAANEGEAQEIARVLELSHGS